MSSILHIPMTGSTLAARQRAPSRERGKIDGARGTPQAGQGRQARNGGFLLEARRFTAPSISHSDDEPGRRCRASGVGLLPRFRHAGDERLKLCGSRMIFRRTGEDIRTRRRIACPRGQHQAIVGHSAQARDLDHDDLSPECGYAFPARSLPGRLDGCRAPFRLSAGAVEGGRAQPWMTARFRPPRLVP